MNGLSHKYDRRFAFGFYWDFWELTETKYFCPRHSKDEVVSTGLTEPIVSHRATWIGHSTRVDARCFPADKKWAILFYTTAKRTRRENYSQCFLKQKQSAANCRHRSAMSAKSNSSVFIWFLAFNASFCIRISACAIKMAKSYLCIWL